jgi:hypothetical protein
VFENFGSKGSFLVDREFQGKEAASAVNEGNMKTVSKTL